MFFNNIVIISLFLLLIIILFQCFFLGIINQYVFIVFILIFTIISFLVWVDSWSERWWVLELQRYFLSNEPAVFGQTRLKCPILSELELLNLFLLFLTCLKATVWILSASHYCFKNVYYSFFFRNLKFLYIFKYLYYGWKELYFEEILPFYTDWCRENLALKKFQSQSCEMLTLKNLT